MQVNMLEAKNQLSKLVKAALAGEEVIIANHGTPVVRLVKLPDPPRTRGYGVWKGLVEMADDWDSPQTNAAIADAILNNPLFPTPRALPKPASKTRRKR
ncbi:MAG: type II toxin-antitoxin system prevent-host-death family antitoxin [Burkholderiaceae bacterium]